MEPHHLLILQGKNVACKKHLEGIRHQHELVQFFNMMIEETLAEKLFKEFCGRNEAEGKPASIDKIPEVLLSVLPLCCFLRDLKVDAIKQKIKPLPQRPPKPDIAERVFTPVEFIQQMGWKQVSVFKDKVQAESYAKGFADARKKSEVVILNVQASLSPDERQYEIWTRKFEDRSSPDK